MRSWKTKLRSRSALIAACALVLGGCVAEETVHPFVPGEPMQFPVGARPALLQMGRELVENCDSDGADRTAKCTGALHTRAEHCLPDIGALGTEA